ncbi:MAG TPA: ATPase, T2SS/T4P/T4SS family [Burkholderiales bacterium]|nr:ATPase, T2SS/T4P/T4SS family [Burkholderiales bacterium]
MSTTANLGRAVLPMGVPQADLPGAESLIEWPLPPFHEAVGEIAPVFEGAVITCRDRRKVTGRLMRFSPATGTVEFCLERATNAQVLALSDILELRLARPVRLRPRKSALSGGTGKDVPSGSLPFRLELIKGPPLEGETYGFQVHSIGLFLYIRSAEDAAIRAFYPATAIRCKQIGKPLGELLVDRQKLSSEQLTSALDQQSATRLQKIGEYLTGANVIEQQELLDALRRQGSQPMLRLGEALIEQGAIKEEQLQAALARQKTERDKPIGELLVELGFLTRAELRRVLTQKLGIPYVDLAKFPIDPQVLELLPRAVAIEYNIVPLCMDGRILVLAVENPLDPRPLERARFLTSMKTVAVMASGDDIRRAIARHFVDPVIDAPVENFAAELESPDQPDAGNEEDLSPEADSALVRLVNKMIADARASGVSDVHIEANGGKTPVRIRFREDGALREYLTLPQHYRRSLVSRIKVMASLDISEKRRGQDGKIRFQQAGAAPLELRVATIPTLDGREDIVLRLLSSGAPVPLDKLGLRAELRESVDQLVQRPHGIFIVCGPTGSGKTTTLHSILGHINTADLKIWTAEDPVEIQQEGLRQVQVNPRAGWTFAAAMRSFLRADPDVIMVGEMRDTETAQIAVEASLTGHTVFSTLHTNNSVDTVVRLLDMGVQPFNFADSLLGVLAQRLVRKLCFECRTAEALDGERALALATEYCTDTPFEPRAVLAEWEGSYGPLQLWSARGCAACRDTGYRGRIGVHELFVNTPAIAPLIHRRADAHELRRLAMPAGMRTLKQDGIDKCLQGFTDLKEVRGNCA